MTAPTPMYGTWAYITDDYVPQTYSFEYTPDTVETGILLTEETPQYGTWAYCHNSDFLDQEED